LCWNRFLEPLWPKSYRSWYFISWLVLFSMNDEFEPMPRVQWSGQRWVFSRSMMMDQSPPTRARVICASRDRPWDGWAEQDVWSKWKESRNWQEWREKSHNVFSRTKQQSAITHFGPKNLAANGFISKWYSRLICIYFIFWIDYKSVKTDNVSTMS